MTGAACITVHATTVVIGGRGLLITGPSGSGKSALALQLMAYGAALVADDQTELTQRDGVLFATCPARLCGLIEARGVGILHADDVPEACLTLVVDLGQTEMQRFPLHRSVTLLDVSLPLVLGSQSAHFPASILHYLMHGRQA